MSALVQVSVWFNVLANAIGRLALAPIALLPGWLSVTAVSAASGLFLLIVFKYTSNQRARKRVHNDIKANLLALKLFGSSASVALRAQGGILRGAFRLLVLALVPMLVMIVPVSLLLGQLSLWYQRRPLKVGEEAVMTLKLNESRPPPSVVCLRPTSAVEVTIGPVRVLSKGEVSWNVKARQNGYHSVRFQVDEWTGSKELAIGDGFMRLSQERPAWSWPDVLIYPSEQPFRPDAPVQSIEIDYPERVSWTSGTGYWTLYWLLASMVAALCFRPFLKAHF
jgi:hypothetical protein